LERNLSQERLADLAGLNYKYLSRVERGRSEPGADILVRLARALAVPVGELFETITPQTAAPFRVSPADVEDMSAALSTMTEFLDRLRNRQPRSLPSRAPRRKKRSQ
jgi:transcriptional regulator with XRE-family HTH domain